MRFGVPNFPYAHSMPDRDPAPPAPAFFGREDELLRLREAVQGGGPDEPATVLVIVGEPGIGKTALLDQVLDRDRTTNPVQVVRVTGDEAEADLDYGLIDQVVRMARLDTETRDHPSALAGTNPLDVGARLLQMIDALGPEPLLVVTIDDAQAVDALSLDAFTFAARRLQGDQVALVVATRPEGLKRLPPGLLRVAERTGGIVTLSGLDVEALGELAAATYGRPVSDAVAARLHAHTDGHPLHARILLEQASLEQLTNTAELSSLPSLSSLVVDRLVTCSEPARLLLDALSVLDAPAAVGTAAALVRVEDPLPAVEELIELGLVDAHDDVGALTDAGPTATDLSRRTPITVSFRHKLVRVAVYAALPTPRRIALHLAAAAQTSGEEALRHRVASATGPDPVLMADLTEQADRDASRGALLLAARHLFAAATVAEPDARERCVLAGADHLQAMGRPLGSWTDEIERFPDSVRRSAVLGRARMTEGRFGEAKILLEHAWVQGGEGQGQIPASVVASIAECLAVIAISTIDTEAILAWAQRLEDTGAATLATTLRCHGLALQGDLDEARRQASALVATEATGHPDADARMGRGIVSLWSNHIEDARRDLSSVLNGPIDHSLMQSLVARSHLADAHLRAGHLVEAADLADIAIGLLDDSQAVWLTPLPHSVAAYAHTAAGDLDRARQHAEVASMYARATSEAPAMIWAYGAWLRIADAEQDHAGVVAAGDRMLAAGLDAVAEGINHWRAAYVEALAVLGRHDDAQRVLDGLEANVERSGDVSLATEAARARATLAIALDDADAASAAFDLGLALDAAQARPLPRGQLELAAGSFHRRNGRRTAAATLLQMAAQRLAAIGAQPWLERCQRELTACGLRPVKRSAPDATTSLTPQERVISRLVAEGRTNRQVADELYVSVKTIEHHLSRIYAKLGVRTRTQMAAALTTPTDPA